MGVAVVVIVATACGDDGSSGDEGMASGTTTMQSGGDTMGSGSMTTQGPGETEGADSGSGDTDSEPPGEPMVEPGSCGYSGSAFVCGYADVGGSACPTDAAVGQPCEGTLANCCLDGTTQLICTCDGNACDFVWVGFDCGQGQGAGTCGWNADADAYTCGGEGEDPGGAPIECPDDTAVECPVGDTCCSADGDARRCVEANGVSSWQTIDCVLD